MAQKPWKKYLTEEQKQDMIDKEYSRVKREMMKSGLRSDEAADFAMEAANAMAASLENEG